MGTNCDRVFARTIKNCAQSGKLCGAVSASSGNRTDAIAATLGTDAVTTFANIVVSCSNRKRKPAPPTNRAASLSACTPDARVKQWSGLLDRSKVDRLSAAQLYQGEHWTTVRRIQGELGGGSVHVASAGYGLVPLDAPLAPYGATFSPREADWVVPSSRSDDWRHYVAEWWKCLAAWQPRDVTGPRSLRELARSHPDRPLIVAASEPYITAMTADLLAAASELTSASLLTVISAGASRLDADVAAMTAPCSGELQGLVGGSLQALNARIVLHLVCGPPNQLTRNCIRREVLAMADEAPEVKRPKRSPMSDDDVRIWIHQQVDGSPKATHSGLLRVLRDEGRACEQSRFRDLFREVKEVRHGSS